MDKSCLRFCLRGGNLKHGSVSTCLIKYWKNVSNLNPSSQKWRVILRAIFYNCSWQSEEFPKTLKNKGGKMIIVLHCHLILNRSMGIHAFSSSGSYCAVLHSTSDLWTMTPRSSSFRPGLRVSGQKSLDKSAKPLPKCSSNRWRWVNNVVHFKAYPETQPRKRIFY